jgi:hypothetical protein
MATPKFIKQGDLRGLENTEETKQPWNGPSAEVMLALAMQQPGAKMRVHGVKFQCAGCLAEGHDKSRDNACVFLDGRFSCAVGGAQHRKAIAEQLNIPEVVVVKPRPPVTSTYEVKPRPPLTGYEVKPRPPLPARRSI